jgi:hypothetical protein
MFRIVRLILIFPLFFSCHSSPSDPENKGPDHGNPGHEPFDRHAQLVFTRHARCRMDCRHITAKEIQEVLDNGSINYNKSEPESRPDPKYAVDGYTAEQQHLRIVVAPEQTKLIIITCIELGVEWSCHCN